MPRPLRRSAGSCSAPPPPFFSASWSCDYPSGSERCAEPGQREFILVGGVLFPVVTLTALLTYGLMLTGARVGATDAGALRIEVTGEQWWWRVRYPATGNAMEIVTANEIRIPTGRQVEIKLSSTDVIHSFWVPSLAGKVDMVPGSVNRMRLKATKTGAYRGQCAEYVAARTPLMGVSCGRPGTRLSSKTGLSGQREPAAAAVNSLPLQKQGESLFCSTGCNACHAHSRGTPRRPARSWPCT